MDVFPEETPRKDSRFSAADLNPHDIRYNVSLLTS